MANPPFGNTLNQLAIGKSKPFTEQVDNITENAPIVKIMPFNQSSDQLWDVSSALTSINASVSNLDLNSPLPEIEITDGLRRSELSIFGAQLFVPHDTALLEGGADKYFGKNRKSFERQTGMDVEMQYVYNAFLPFALQMKKEGHDTMFDAGGTNNANYSLLVVRFEDSNFCGLYSPICFKRDTFLQMFPVNGGNLYAQSATGHKYYNVLGYGLAMKTYMGVRMLSWKNICAIVNIDLSESTPFTARMVDSALLEARVGEAGKTVIMCHPKVKLWLQEIGKVQRLETTFGDRAVNHEIDTWNGVPIVTSYNFMDGSETNITVPA
ncbi:MAG: hypothetical protein LBQ10_12020 [Desulfovibrio sp.]|jgi:hypothetical protein|nr:hypothetical protein [Desulfovibrio sp.]